MFFLQGYLDILADIAASSKTCTTDGGRLLLSTLHNSARLVHSPVTSPGGWKTLATGSVKLSSDASFDLTTCSTFLGALLCDERGNVIAAGWGVGQNCSDPEEAEALACRKGVRLKMDFKLGALWWRATTSS